jgi:periplasmic divalent cation tolerance protein
LQENDKPVLIYSTFPSAAEAERIGGALVDRGLAACVNIFDGMTSIYIWQGKRERGAEAAMLIKTRAALASQVIAETRKLHPNTNPALLVLPVSDGSPDFMRWIAEQTAN